MVVEVNGDTFEPEVIDASQERLVAVKFYGDACPMCKAMSEDYERLALSYDSEHAGVKFCALNTGKNRRIALTRRVMSQPTIVVYRAGRELFRLVREEAVAELLRLKLSDFLGDSVL